MGIDKDGREEEEPETCQYRGYRNGPDDNDKYGLSPQYWHIFAARLAFVVVFEVRLEVCIKGLADCCKCRFIYK